MSYKIEKQTDKSDFIVKYNHTQGLMLQDGAELVDSVYTEFTYALLPNEVMTEEQADIEVDVPDFETKIEEYEEPIFDENGEIIGYEIKTYEVQVPIMIKVEEVILVPIFDEEGNFIGEEEQKVTREVQATHKEMRTVTLRYPVINPNYEEEQAQKEKERVARLSCTKRDFALMLQELGVDYFTQLKPLIESNPQAQLEWELCERLFRFNPMLDLMAIQLGVTSEQLDGLFRYANGEITIDEFRALIPPVVEDEIIEEDVEVEND
jgi:hypothetical protein